VGSGKLYNLVDSQFITNVDYQVFEHPAATNWWGELILSDNAHPNEGDTFIIEFEDHRRSKCRLKKRVNRAVSGYPPHYMYHVTGFSAIE